MLKHIFFYIFLFISIYSLNAQTVYNDGLIQYSISVVEGSNTASLQYLKGATLKFYIRGMQTRSELNTTLGSTTTILDQQTGGAVVLSDYGDQKIMVRMNSEQYKQTNKKYLNPLVEIQKDQKSIKGYDCKLAKVKFLDGNTISVYYTPDLKFLNSYYGIPVQVDGFPLEYEAKIGNINVLYRAEKISTDPVSASLFNIPNTGYREMKFEEMPK
jgi:GLPGLI family protein